MYPSFQSDPPSFGQVLAQRVHAILQEHGIVIANDQQPSGMKGNILGISFDSPDAGSDEDDGAKEEYDDRPGIDRMMDFLTKAFRKRKGPPVPVYTRVLGLHPSNCTALVVIGMTFTSADPGVSLTDSIGSWAAELRNQDDTITFGGTVMDHKQLHKLFHTL